MRRKYLVFAMSCVFVLGLSGSVMAYDDTTGEAFVSAVDIATVTAEVFDIPSGGGIPEKVKLGVKMNLGSHLPGFINWDIDVDNDTTTGTVTILGAPIPDGCKPSGCKQTTGYDISIGLALRTQSDSGMSNAHCTSCEGGTVICLERGDLCSDCGGDTCYALTQESCVQGDPNCYELSTDSCSCAEESCYTNYVSCGTSGTASCAIGMTKGEWYASTYLSPGCVSIPGAHNRFVRGDMYLPTDFDLLTESEICITLPWAKIVSILHDKGGGCFDDTVAVTGEPQVQVRAYFDENFASGDKEDLLMDLADYVPDVVNAFQATRETTPTCLCDDDNDGDCDGTDAFGFKLGFGTSTCPECDM